jgi:hypothetical protein
MAMDPRIMAALLSAVGSVPGCSIMRPERQPIEKLTTRLRIVGRSPSLHEMPMPAIIDHDMDVAAAMSVVEPILAQQRRRAEASIALGHAFPMHMYAGYGVSTPIEIMHLHVDATTLAVFLSSLASGTHQSEIVRRISDWVVGAHRKRSASRNPLAPTLAVDDVSVSERLGMPTVDKEVGMIGKGGVTQSWYRRQRLRIEGATLPETIAAAIAGRHVGDVLRVHSYVNDRIVRTAASKTLRDGPCVDLELEPRTVLLGDVLARDDVTASEARDLVVARLRQENRA